MDTYWLIGHDELPPPDQLASMGMDEIFESVFEPEFLQNIWERWIDLHVFLLCFHCRDHDKILLCVRDF